KTFRPRQHEGAQVIQPVGIYCQSTCCRMPSPSFQDAFETRVDARLPYIETVGRACRPLSSHPDDDGRYVEGFLYTGGDEPNDARVPCLVIDDSHSPGFLVLSDALQSLLHHVLLHRASLAVQLAQMF